MGFRFYRPLKNRHITCSPRESIMLWGNLHTTSLQLFGHLLLHQRKYNQYNGVMGPTLPLYHWKNFQWIPHLFSSTMWSVKLHTDTTTDTFSPQSTSIFMRGIHLIVAPSPIHTNPNMFAFCNILSQFCSYMDLKFTLSNPPGKNWK